MPQRLESINLLSLRYACSKLQFLFLDANIKINDLFDPTICGLKAIFSYTGVVFLILLVFFFCWKVFLRIKYYPQKLNPAK